MLFTLILKIKGDDELEIKEISVMFASDFFAIARDSPANIMGMQINMMQHSKLNRITESSSNIMIPIRQTRLISIDIVQQILKVSIHAYTVKIYLHQQVSIFK